MKQILLIEDHPEMRENTAEILELSGYEVITAVDGIRGVEKARKHLPDLIISDIMMPGLDGFGVLRILNQQMETASIPFIFLTAKTEMTDLRKGMGMGADDYLTKPYDEVELMNAIEIRLKKNEINQKDFDTNIDGLNNFFNEVRSHQALEMIPNDREVRFYNTKDQIFFEGSHATGLLFVIKGKIKAYKTNPDAKELITHLYKPGDFVGYTALLSDSPYSESAMALENTEVAVIPKKDFLALIYNNRDVSNAFIRMVSQSLIEKKDRLLHLAYDSVRMRVAEALLSFQERYDDQIKEGNFSMKITRDNLAGMVGTSKECVIRVLSDFKTEKVIRTNMSEITILDAEGLERISG